ncbi:MAG: nitronate monooxygenase [Betaproteobacteria bacterium]|nr:nitronate monooxygenase [Betaproteobacteria bacterium]
MLTNSFESLLAQCRLPVVCAPMFLVSGPELVIAACEAGVIGSFPTMNCRTVEDLENWFVQIEARFKAARSAGRAPAPWAANLVVHSTNQRLPRDLELVARFQPPMVITALGSPRAAVAPVHAYGGLVFADVTTPLLARKALDAGADGLVMVCAGAGGHTGALAAPAFIAEVREFFSGPVILAGALANGRAIRAYQMLGADLVYMGTSFIASSESLAASEHKRMLVEAKGEAILATKAFTGATANYLIPSIVAAGLDPANLKDKDKMDASDPQNKTKAWKNIWSAGQAVGQVHAVEPAHAIVERLVQEYAAALRAERDDPWARRILGQSS